MSDNNKEVVKETAVYHPIFPGNEFEKPEKNLIYFKPFVLVLFLIVIFFLLKSFIYTPDEKRDGK